MPHACPRCHGRGHVSEDPAPDCPSVAYPTEECPRCEGTGWLDADGGPVEAPEEPDDRPACLACGCAVPCTCDDEPFPG